MSENPNVAAPMDAPPAKSAMPKVLLGCGIAFVLIVIVCVIAGVWSYKWYTGNLQKSVDALVAQGFTRVDVTEPVTGDVAARNVYFSPAEVRFEGDSTGDIAIVAASGVVSGHVGGTIYFRGVSLAIEPGAVVDGDVDVAGLSGKPALVENAGAVKGQMVGTYQLVQPPAAPAAPEAPQSTEAAPEASAVESTQTE